MTNNKPVHEHRYTQCRECHLFVEPNPAFGESPGLAKWIHLHRDTPDDQALDENHEPTPAPGPAHSLDYWRMCGPPAMRARFVKEPPQEPTFTRAQLVREAAGLLNDPFDMHRAALAEYVRGMCEVIARTTDNDIDIHTVPKVRQEILSRLKATAPPPVPAMAQEVVDQVQATVARDTGNKVTDPVWYAGNVIADLVRRYPGKLNDTLHTLLVEEGSDAGTPARCDCGAPYVPGSPIKYSTVTRGLVGVCPYEHGQD